ncbi:MAG TPA: alpha/beta fold hydrolase [Candidatus Fimivicinus intestinavium]|nr:alpha/beta fold hydrolase [Candidatus Fimivicinus intestinavium]
MKYILLHGLGQTAASWDRTIEAMGRRPEILSPDLFDWLAGKPVCYADLYHAFERYCGQFHEPLHLCGLSLGGILALQYGIEHSGSVASLVLIGTQYTMPKRLLQVQNGLFHVMPRAAFQKMGLEKKDVIHLTQSMMDLDFQQDLQKISCRTLVICGERDRANQSAALQLKERLPHAQMVMIANAGHEVNIDQPAALGKVLRSFYQ